VVKKQAVGILLQLRQILTYLQNYFTGKCATHWRLEIMISSATSYAILPTFERHCASLWVMRFG